MNLRFLIFCVLLSLSLFAGSCKLKNHDEKPVDDKVFIQAKDTKLFAHIKGNNNKSPVLIYLHGGPGSPLGVPIFKAYTGHKLEQEFVVVYLHQRGIMKSERVDMEKHTISKYVEDVHHVVNYVKNRFDDREIFLIGHSWGGILSYLYLLSYPNETDRLITVCTPVNAKTLLSDRIKVLLQWASENNIQEAVEELGRLKNKSPEAVRNESEILKKWMTKAYGGWHRNLDITKVNGAIDYENKISEWMKEQKQIEDAMIEDILRIDLRDSVRQITIPLLCIAGQYDTNAPWQAIKRDIKNFGGEITFTLFENSHHMVFIDEEELFIETVVNFCNP